MCGKIPARLVFERTAGFKRCARCNEGKEVPEMHRKWFWIYAGLMITLAAPLPAQRGGGGAGGGGGLGLGRTAGGVAGTATGTVNSTVNGTTRGTVHEEGRTGANAGSTRGLGASEGALGVAQNAQLSSRLQTLLPASTTVPAAAAGFENQGQFIAAVHAAHNLNIPFDQL